MTGASNRNLPDPTAELFRRLHGQLAEQRSLQQVMAERTEAFLACLIERHDLPNLLAEDQTLEGIPRAVLIELKHGHIPSLDDLALLSPQDHGLLIRELVWICGHGAIRWYREQGLSSMGESWDLEKGLSTVGWSETYVRAALALLLSADPPLELLSLIMPPTHSSQDQIERNKSIYLYLEDAILRRHLEDVRYAVINAV
jgi:hypothetical protein